MVQKEIQVSLISQVVSTGECFLLHEKRKKKPFIHSWERRKTGIPEDENKLLVQTSQKVFMLYHLQYPTKFKRYSTK